MKKIISTPTAPAAVGPYSQAIEANGLIFISGQLPIDVQTGEIISSDIKEQTLQSFKNIKAILQSQGLDTSHIVKTTVLLANIGDFAAMNEVYATQFADNFPARSAFAVKDLPKGALVEIEVVAYRG